MNEGAKPVPPMIPSCPNCGEQTTRKVCEHCGGLGVKYPPLLTDWEIRFLNGEFFANIDMTVHCP